MAHKTLDWQQVLDLELAQQNIEREFIRDWYHDPWGWPELPYLMKHGRDTLVAHLNGVHARRAALIDVPKENWGVRPAVVLDIVDRLAYQALVDRLSTDFIGTLPWSVFGWRLPPVDPERGVYSHNNVQWDAYRTHLALAASSDAALQTDLVGFFASIPVEDVCALIDNRTGKGALPTRLISLIEGFDKMPERSGLPQRSIASAVIANMFLSPLDDVLEVHSVDLTPHTWLFAKGSSTPRRSNARWMDDMWLFGDHASSMRRAQKDLQDAARSLGLSLNSGKTQVLEGEDVAQAALEVEHSAVDFALSKKRDTKPLEEMLDAIIESPEAAGRTTVRFALLRMRKAHSKYRLQELVSAAARMPHCADLMAPVVKSAMSSHKAMEWFLDYAGGDWAIFDWSVAQYVFMFPSVGSPGDQLCAYMQEVIAARSAPLPLLAMAAQRLSAWHPTHARATIRERLRETGGPQERRVLVLAALSAGESATQCRRWLGQEEENAVTASMLDGRSFAAPKVVSRVG